MNILLTGGLGFIGSHTAVELLNNNHHVIIVDNLSNSNHQVLNNIKEIANFNDSGFHPEDNISFYHCDVGNKNILNNIFNNHDINTVIHFAAYKAVGESVSNPLKYYPTLFPRPNT